MIFFMWVLVSTEIEIFLHARACIGRYWQSDLYKYNADINEVLDVHQNNEFCS